MQRVFCLSVLAATMAASMTAMAAQPVSSILAPGKRPPTVNDCNPEYGFVPPPGVDMRLCEDKYYDQYIKEQQELQKQQQQAGKSRTH